MYYDTDHFGEIPAGIVYKKLRSIADPTLKDFKNMALGPVLHFEHPIRCNITHSKFAVVSSSNSLCYTNIRMQIFCVHTENSICVHCVFEVIQDEERNLLVLLNGSDHSGDWINEGKQFCTHFYFRLTQPGLAFERINAYITDLTLEDFSNMLLRPELELSNNSSTTLMVSYNSNLLTQGAWIFLYMHYSQRR